MGCGGSKTQEEGIDLPLDSELDTIGVESVDEVFARASTVIANLEKIRETVIDKRDYLILKTGACCHITPDLAKSIHCFLWKLAVDNGGDIMKTDLEISSDSPYLKINPNQSQENAEIMENFIDYIGSMIELPDKAVQLQTQIEDLSKEVTAGYSKYSTDVKTKLIDNAMVIPSRLKKVESNSSKVTTAGIMSKNIVTELMKAIDEFKSIVGLMNKSDEIAKVNRIAKAALTAKLQFAADVAYFSFQPNERYGKSSKDGVSRYTQKSENKREKKAKKKEKEKKK